MCFYRDRYNLQISVCILTHILLHRSIHIRIYAHTPLCTCVSFTWVILLQFGGPPVKALEILVRFKGPQGHGPKRVCSRGLRRYRT